MKWKNSALLRLWHSRQGVCASISNEIICTLLHPSCPPTSQHPPPLTFHHNRLDGGAEETTTAVLTPLKFPIFEAAGDTISPRGLHNKLAVYAVCSLMHARVCMRAQAPFIQLSAGERLSRDLSCCLFVCCCASCSPIASVWEDRWIWTN